MLNFSGKKYIIAMSYASLGFAVGIIVAPFIGSYLEYYFNWKASFWLYSIFGTILCLFVIFFIKEENPSEDKRSKQLNSFLKSYVTMIKHPYFILSTLILSLIVAQNMLFPTIGPFIFKFILLDSALSYGRGALVLGLGYLFGTLANRILLKYLDSKVLIIIGCFVFFVAIILQLYFVTFSSISFMKLIAPIALMSCSLGFIYSNVVSVGLSFFPNNSGMAAALQGFIMIAIGSTLNLVVGHIVVSYFFIVALIYAVLFFLQLCLITTLILTLVKRSVFRL
jgi:predicted MFS family arabinose efflux permease